MPEVIRSTVTRSPVEGHEVLAVQVAAELGHALEIDYRGAVDALEARRVEALLELAHGGAQDMRVLGRVHAHVVAGGVDPQDTVAAHAHDARAVPDRQRVRARARGGPALERSL